ncbi:MAG: P1 family peptidase [Tropicimonas sp.]|uniref:P1 family peptidase n=1 Tax=Tropicimonas sp. TaxID=2067044 RepID=UPI003A85F27F
MRNTIPPGGAWGLAPGPRNTICDVAGIRVGHRSLRGTGEATGVTAILPHGGDLYRRPVPAGAAVLNGFGKSAGLVQLQELGEIETPILLTNTFGVPACATALIRHAIATNPEIGRSQPTVNPLVCECNDGKVNDIQALPVREADALAAIAAAAEGFEQGTVGAGSGMRTFGFAGGVGSASRRVALEGGTGFMLGALVLSNFGEAGDLRVFGDRVATPDATPAPDKGSVIIVLATDAPLDARQLTRLARRSAAALGRLGSYIGHQSGDIALAFSTANVVDRTDNADIHPATRLNEARMNAFFKAGVEAVEEAVLNAIWHGAPLPGYDGSRLPSFRETLRKR